MLLSLYSFHSVAGTTITKLSLRDYNVAIATTSSGLTYTIEDKNGKLVAKELSEKQLQAAHPQVYEAIKPAIAKDTIMDASLSKEHGSPSIPKLDR